MKKREIHNILLKTIIQNETLILDLSQEQNYKYLGYIWYWDNLNKLEKNNFKKLPNFLKDFYFVLNLHLKNEKKRNS